MVGERGESEESFYEAVLMWPSPWGPMSQKEDEAIALEELEAVGSEELCTCTGVLALRCKQKEGRPVRLCLCHSVSLPASNLSSSSG